MTSSPLKKNYIHEIRNIKPFKPSQPEKKYKNQVKKNIQPKHQNTLQVYNDCIRSKICLEKYPDKYFQLVLFQSGIFNINLVQISKILSQSERKNISKLCIPNQERILKGLYLFPTQTIVLCQFDLQSRFHRQMITYCPGQYLIVNNFTNGRIDKEQFNFNLKDLILVKTIYQNDRIMKVTDYFYGNDNRTYLANQEIHSKLKIKLQKYLKDKKLCQTIYQMIDAKFDWLEPIQTKSGTTHYYGLLDSNQQLPAGLGLLINHKGNRKRTKSFSQLSTYEQSFDSGWEFYFGFFQSGLLNGIGQIWFQNKSSYYGQFDFGNAIGLGQFYSLQPSNSIQSSNQCFSYKDDMKPINQSDFFKWLKQSYFNGQKTFTKKKNKVFIHNQYQKLRKIYAIPKKKQIILPQQSFKRQSIDQNSQEIDDLMDQISQVNLKINDRSDPQGQDITFNKNDQIKDIFQKIKVRDQKAQKIETNSNKRLNIGKINTEKFQQNQRKNTSRSDDHTYNIFGNRNNEEYSKGSKIRRNNTHLHQIQGQFREYENLPHFQHSQMNQNQEVDLGYQEVDQSYFRNRQVNSSYKDMIDKDFINKQYVFEEPKRFKTPDYFIVQYGKNDPKYDPTGAKSNLFSQNIVKKNEYSGPSPIKRQKYLSPERKKTNNLGQKQNEHQIQKLQKTLTTAKNKRIFYNATKRNQV